MRPSRVPTHMPLPTPMPWLGVPLSATYQALYQPSCLPTLPRSARPMRHIPETFCAACLERTIYFVCSH